MKPKCNGGARIFSGSKYEEVNIRKSKRCFNIYYIYIKDNFNIEMNPSGLPGSAPTQVPSRIQIAGDICETVSVLNFKIFINQYTEDL